MGSVTRVAPDGANEADTSFGRSVLTTRLDQLVNWARSGSLWPLPFGTACCAIEFMSVVSSHYDLSRFGAEVVRFSPRQSDVLIVAGTVTDKQSPILKQIWEQMAEPKWCIAMGVCASSGGFYRAYHVTQGIDEVIPVDVYVPGCPPTPEGLIYAILELQRKIRGERRISEEGIGGRRRRSAAPDGTPSADAAGPRPGARLLNDPEALAAAVARETAHDGGAGAGPGRGDAPRAGDPTARGGEPREPLVRPSERRGGPGPRA
jgi:NADH-quinone oxidoreductase subunit B